MGTHGVKVCVVVSLQRPLSRTYRRLHRRFDKGGTIIRGTDTGCRDGDKRMPWCVRVRVEFLLPLVFSPHAYRILNYQSM